MAMPGVGSRRHMTWCRDTERCGSWSRSAAAASTLEAHQSTPRAFSGRSAGLAARQYAVDRSYVKSMPAMLSCRCFIYSLHSSYQESTVYCTVNAVLLAICFSHLKRQKQQAFVELCLKNRLPSVAPGD